MAQKTSNLVLLALAVAGVAAFLFSGKNTATDVKTDAKTEAKAAVKPEAKAMVKAEAPKAYTVAKVKKHMNKPQMVKVAVKPVQEFTGSAVVKH